MAGQWHKSAHFRLPVLALVLLLLTSVASVSGQEAAAPTPDPNTATLLELSRNPLVETRTPSFRPVVPARAAEAVRTSQIAAAQLSLRFGGAPGTEGPIEATYGSERTQVPVIAAVFVDEECDKNLTHDEYRARANRHATLAYKVLSAPRNFGPYAISLDHWHVNEARRTHIKTTRFANLETFAVHRASVNGLLPGVNEFALRVHLTDTAGTTSTSDASTHLVVVSEVAAMALATDHATGFSTQDLGGGRSAYRGDSVWQASFLLSPALNADAMSVRVLRRGSRQFRTDRLPAAVQRDVGLPLPPGGWEQFATVPLTGGQAPGLTVESLGGRRYAISLNHILRASSTLAPLSDEWEYRVAIYHSNIADPVEVITAHAGASIGGPDGDWMGIGDTREAIVRVKPEAIRLDGE